MGGYYGAGLWVLDAPPEDLALMQSCAMAAEEAKARARKAADEAEKEGDG